MDGMNGEVVMLRWKLNELMARMRISNKELGTELDRHETSVSRLRSSDTMPRLDGDSLNNLCTALTVISRRRGNVGSIGPAELFDFTPDVDLDQSPVSVDGNAKAEGSKTPLSDSSGTSGLIELPTTFERAA